MTGPPPSPTPYAGMAEAWASDAGLAYGPLARHLLSRTGADLRGLHALDAGAGTGAAGDALRAAGAQVVAVDLELDMVRYGRPAGPVVAADITALPFPDCPFDLGVAAFVVNHLEHIDWGDAMVTDPYYELAALHLGTFHADKDLLRVFLDAYGWPVDAHFARRAMQTALMHRFDVLSDVAGQLVQADTFDQLAEHLWL